jgi:putative membrane protein
MRQVTYGVMIMAALMLLVGKASGQAGAGSDPDKCFIEAAAVHGMFEQQLAEAAAQQASDQQVKDFAKKMAEDHKSANDQCKQVAQKIGVTVPSNLPEMKQRELDTIKAQQGKDFDQCFLSAIKAGHLFAVSKYADEAQIAKNQDVKNFAQQILPKLQEHQQRVLSLAQAQGLPTTGAEAQTAGSTQAPANPPAQNPAPNR